MPPAAQPALTRRQMGLVGCLQLIASFREVPEELTLDFDATDDRVHGLQQGRFFHGYSGDWCFLPLSVFFAASNCW